MPSWRARIFSLGVRLLMRRADWGDERQLVQRARRVFGASRSQQWLRTRDVRIEPVNEGGVRGEWIVPSDATRGTLMYFHGGGYVAGGPAPWRPITAGFARLSRRRVFSLDYRLAPEHRFPAALDDAVAAYRWLLANGTPASALALAGDSAGGGLVLATLIRLRDEGVSLPAAAVCLSPWTDLAGTGDSLHGNDGRCPTFRPRNIPDFARIYLGGVSPKHPLASPVFAELGGLPPLLIQVSSNELLLDDARRIHERVTESGGRSRLDVFDDVFHSWPMLDGFMPEARTALQEAAAFVNAAA